MAIENGLLKVAYREIDISESTPEIKNLQFEEMSKEELALKLEGLDGDMVSMR